MDRSILNSTEKIALIVSTYQQPEHLRKCLLSIALQRQIAPREIEVVVTDDGSTDHTPEVVAGMARRMDCRVQFTTHAHDSHRVARCRNRGAALTRAPYLLFLDGDCILPPDHLAQHLARRRVGFATGADCCRLDRETSERINDEVIARGDYQNWVPAGERKRLKKLARSAWVYNLIRHATKPRLIGNNIAIWRDDFERLNGFDEKFVGWGCEDDDLRLRLRQAEVRIQSIVGITYTFHLWHPTDPTAPRSGHSRDAANVPFIKRPYRLTRCLNGLQKRGLNNLDLRVVTERALPEPVERTVEAFGCSAHSAAESEVEVLVVPGNASFSGRADCNILVVLEPSRQARRLTRQADLVVADQRYAGISADRQFKLNEFRKALRAVA